MRLKSLLGWAVIAFLAFYMLKDPTAAGHTVQGWIGGLKNAANSLATFLSSV